MEDGVPKGIRTPVVAVRGRCPRPLDDGDLGRKLAAGDGVPKGIRTPVAAVKGQCPRPLDDGDPEQQGVLCNRPRCLRQPFSVCFISFLKKPCLQGFQRAGAASSIKS